MEIDIYEDEKQVGTVDIDTETYEYRGQLDEIERVLQRMDAGEITMPHPVAPADGYDGPYDSPGITHIRRSGIALAQWLPRVLEQKGRGEVEVYAHAVDYERDYLPDHRPQTLK